MLEVDLLRVSALRAVITVFLKERLADKLDALGADDPKRTVLIAQFVPDVWIEDATRRVSQIQAVTHSLKPIHPDAKGTNLYSPPQTLAKTTVIGSHCLTDQFMGDVVGNAAALDVYKFLKLEHKGKSLLALILLRDVDLAHALSDEPLQAEKWMGAFAGIVAPRGRLASHTLAKQFFWLVGDPPDPHDDASFHLLAPLYASSLAQQVFLTVQDDRFSEEAKVSRQARKDGVFSARPVREYPQLAIQNLGGTKPQNISQLNSERRGDNLLFASLPPTWKSDAIKPPLGADAMLQQYGRRAEVKQIVRALLAFLKSDPASTQFTRARRDSYVNALIDEFLQFSAELQALSPGWSQAPDCKLGSAEKCWLDPEGVCQSLALAGQVMPTDIAKRVSGLFANWLNSQLHDPLPMDDATFLYWRKLMFDEIQAEEREVQHGR